MTNPSDGITQARMTMDLIEHAKKKQQWLFSEPSRELKTNLEVMDYITENGFISKRELPDADRVAMMMAFQLFKEIHGGKISPDSQSPHGCSWHEHYKKLALIAFKNAGGMWGESSPSNKE